MSYGIEVKPKGKRKFKRLSVSMLSVEGMIAHAKAHVKQYAIDHALNHNDIDYRVVNRDNDSIIATKQTFEKAIP